MEFSDGEIELIGAILGDGYLYTKNNKYVVGFTGNQITDREYFNYLEKLIIENWHKNPKKKNRDHAIRIRFNSKKVVSKLLHGGLISGNEKAKNVFIPEEFCDDWDKYKLIIRGLFDTDGTIFVSNKPGSPNYPTIELTTISRTLAFQVKDLLLENGFRVPSVRCHKQKNTKNETYKVALYGRKNLSNWVDKIGFSNFYKQNRAIAALCP